MRGKFGPNSVQVERFLTLVCGLTDGEWEQVGELERHAKSAYGWGDWTDIEITAYRTFGQRDAERLLRSINQRLSGVKDEQARHNAATAAICLALAGELSDAQMAAAYGLFSETIPITNLGPGRAANVDPPPKTAWGSFVKRVCALEDPERQEIVALAYSVERAVGVDGINQAIEAANPADPGFFLAGMKEIERSVDARVDRDVRLNEWMGQAIGNDSFTHARNTRAQTAGDVFWLCAVRALQAVMSRGRMPDKEFAILYTPFAGIIPLESLFPENKD